MRAVWSHECSYEESMKIWIGGLKEAHAESRWKDDFTMSPHELAQIAVSFRDDEATVVAWTCFMRRCDIMITLFNTNNGVLPSNQAQKVVNSCIEFAKECGRDLLERWRSKAQQVHASCEELLAGEVATAIPHRKRRKRKSKAKSRSCKTYTEECIICLDAERSHVFQPCGHRVSCADCAAALARVSATCPWCRCILEKE